MYVSNIQPGNKSLEFIDHRLNYNDYRGDESSQHNRYDMDEIFNILDILNKFSPNKSLMQMRDADISKRPINTPSEIPYAKFCEEVKKKVGKGSQDSIRKNLFVDFHRMDLIERYDSYGSKLGPFTRGAKKFVSLSDDGLKFINSDLLNRAFLFTKAMDKLLGGYIEISLGLLKDEDREISRITKDEFMFFISAIYSKTSYTIDIDKCMELIESWKLLSNMQQKLAVETLKQKLIPNLFKGDKTAKRDWHNWKNKIDQVYHLFSQSPYFNVSGINNFNLQLSTHKVTTKKGEIVELPKRSVKAKHEYFKNHNIKKKPGYELHHVVPLSWANSAEQYKLFDQWKNMVYIDGFSHAKITQNRNNNVNMIIDGDRIILEDNNYNKVELSEGKNILYNNSKLPIMTEYNKSLLTTT